MVRSMFSGIAGLRTHQSKLDVIGNNIANVNTYTYKTTRAVFKESVYQTISTGGDGNAVYGGTNPSQVGYGSTMSVIDRNYGSTSGAPTGIPTDCMIKGNGFFMVGPKVGVTRNDDGSFTVEEVEGVQPTALNLTRLGDFEFDGDGFLVDSAGNVVYGYGVDETGAVDEEAGLQMIRYTPLEVDEEGNAVNPDEGKDYSQIAIGEDGKVTAVNNETNETEVIGYVALANVPNPAALEKLDGPYYRISNGNTGTVTANLAGEGGTALLQTAFLEMANVDLANEFSEMITSQRGFQANSKIITVTDEMLQELVNIKR